MNGPFDFATPYGCLPASVHFLRWRHVERPIHRFPIPPTHSATAFRDDVRALHGIAMDGDALPSSGTFVFYQLDQTGTCETKPISYLMEIANNQKKHQP